MIQDLPILGIGLGFRHKYYADLCSIDGLVDWLEFTPENYFSFGGRSRHYLTEISREYPLVSHGVSLSLGSVDPINPQYIADLQRLFAEFKPHWFSDHLCFSSFNGHYFNDLIPLPYNQESLEHIAGRIKYLQDKMQIPFLFENVSHYLAYQESNIPEYQFINQLLSKADCGLLLDVNNVYVNAYNHHFDPYQYLDNIDLSRVVQVHIAGHKHYPEGIVDTHGEPVIDQVWDLLDHLLSKTQPKGIMLERDLNLPPFEEIKLELNKLRALWDKHCVSEPIIARRSA